MKTFTLPAAICALFASFSFAQEQYTIEPNSVSLHTRKLWCTQQTTQCPLICLQTHARSSDTVKNECNPHTLTYSCLCANGREPNMTEYSETLPYFICTEWGNQCVANCGQDNLCAAACRQDHPCGAQNPVRHNSSTLSTSTTKHAGTAGHHRATTPATKTTSGSGGMGTVCTGLGTQACQKASETSAVADGKSGGGDTSVASRGLDVSLHRSGEAVGFTFLLGLVFLGLALVL